MKFLHISDLHLGRSLGDFDLTRDQQYILSSIIDTAEENDVDGVLVAGDVYDRAIPSEAATGLLDFFLSTLAKKNIRVFMISGNHDSDDRLNFGSSLFESSNIHICTKYNGVLCKKTVRNGDDEADIYLLPFVKASRVRRFHPDAEINSYDDAVRTIIEHADIDKNRCNILISHQFVTGNSEDPVCSGSESPGTKYVGLVEKIGSDCFDIFDYVALGHIHSPQQVGRKGIRYSGSPLKYSLDEVHNEKSMPLVTVGAKGNVDIDLLPLKPLRNVRHLRGSLKDLTNSANITDPDDLIFATLTDEEFHNNAIGIMRQIYPSTVRVIYDNPYTRETEFTDISRIAGNKTFPDLISEFYRQIYGCEISEEEMEIMQMAAGEAGIIDETP